jgi:hypothetical protein
MKIHLGATSLPMFLLLNCRDDHIYFQPPSLSISLIGQIAVNSRKNPQGKRDLNSQYLDISCS